MSFIMADNYLEDRDVLVCPVLDTPYPREPDINWHAGYMTCGYPNGGWNSQKWVGPREFTYFYDEDRIPQDSNPGRVIAADGIEMATSFGMEPPNHWDGSNVLFVDGAVQWATRDYPDEEWQKNTKGTDFKVGQDFMIWYGNDASPWIRRGVIGNPRMEEDGRPNGEGHPDTGKRDTDSIYDEEGRVGDPNASSTDPDHDISGGQSDATFFDREKAARCGHEQNTGQPDPIDTAVAGGSYVASWANWGFDGAWRGCNSGSGPDHNGDSWLRAGGEGDGWQGWVWGVPEPFVSRVYK
jgi:prepilin-type processing-associated H-X9-DG protein